MPLTLRYVHALAHEPNTFSCAFDAEHRVVILHLQIQRTDVAPLEALTVHAWADIRGAQRPRGYEREVLQLFQRDAQTWRLRVPLGRDREEVWLTDVPTEESFLW